MNQGFHLPEAIRSNVVSDSYRRIVQWHHNVVRFDNIPDKRDFLSRERG
jgi:hypothetical protein